MKKLGLSILLFLFVFTLLANEKKKNNNSDSIPRLNEISLVVTDLIDGSYQFRYERKLGTHISVGLGTALKSKDGLVSISGIDREKIKTGDIEYSGFKLVPDVRYYLNKTQQYQLDGFYFGPYMKYFHFKSDLKGTYINSEQTKYDVAFNAKINVISMGLMVGYKLALSKRFNIDFLIFGPGTSRHNYKLKARTELPDEFYDDLNEALQNLSLYDFVNSDFRFDYKNRSTQFTTFSFRYGLTVGYTF